MTRNISYHAQVERQSRIEYIIDWCKGEFGKPVAIIEDESETAKITLTEKGIVIIYNLETNKLVTMWIASPKQGIALYKRAYEGKRMPKGVLNTLYNNKKACEGQPKK